jgi:hypothetical protein
MKIAAADDFQYDDPVDGQSAGTRTSASFEGGSRVFRLSGTGRLARRRLHRALNLGRQPRPRNAGRTADLIAAAAYSGVRINRPRQAERDYVRFSACDAISFR